MSFVYQMIEYAGTFIELYVAYLVFAILFGKDKRIEIPYMNLFFASIGAIGTVLLNNIVLVSNVTLTIVWIYLSVTGIFLYKVRKISVFVVASFYLICLSSFDILVITLAASFYGGMETITKVMEEMGDIRVILMIVVKTLWVLTYIVLRKYLRKISVNINSGYVAILIPIIGFCGHFFMVNDVRMAFNRTMPLIWFMAICVLILIIFIVYFFSERQKEQFKVNFLEMRTKLLSEKYDSINEIYRDNSKLYHDLNNHLNVLYHILDDEHVEEAKEYIKEISKPILRLCNTVWTGIDVVDVVINSKLQRMQELHIESDINVELPENSNISSNDLCTILSNIIDNAIEATEQLPENKWIHITMRRINYFLFIKVVNSCNDVKKFEMLPNTTKENKMFHGWGLQSVSDVVKKYEGTLECVNEKGEFIVKIMLPFDAKQL
ncbi:GHKL domain-containing protein [Faecalicatena sp. Marseille-Q4148]|nr:GHKL domain-containing protein [Faecalicatena sp. Marseille-Q4148]